MDVMRILFPRRESLMVGGGSKVGWMAVWLRLVVTAGLVGCDVKKCSASLGKLLNRRTNYRLGLTISKSHLALLRTNRY